MRLDSKFILECESKDGGYDWYERIGAVMGVVWGEKKLLDDVAKVDDERFVERSFWKRRQCARACA